jgi:LacI family transcriptional regulator
MSITIVAQRAGVSSSTVSRVINNHPRVSPETIRVVRRVMAEMGYVPSDRRPGPKPHNRNQAAARNVAFLKFSARTHASPGSELLLRGISDSCRRQGLNLNVHELPIADEFPKKVFDTPMMGVLLHGAIPTPELRKALNSLPTVWLMGNSVRPDWGDQVMPDGMHIGRLAALYLANRGHRHIAFFNLDSGHWPFRVVWQSFAATAEELGVDVSRIYSPTRIEHRVGSTYDRAALDSLVEAFLQLNPRPTGIYVADDFQTAMVQPALIEHGIKVGPGGVEILSCNNEDAYLMGLSPRPVSIDIRVESVGRRAVDQLMWRAEYPSFEDRVISLIEPRISTPDSGVIAATPALAIAS